MNTPLPQRNRRWQEAAVVAFCAWQSIDLATAWRHSPHDRLGWLVFLLWLAPLALLRVNHAHRARNPRLIVTAALAIAFLGRLLDINALACAGLALSLAGVAPVAERGRQEAWLAGSISWMPLLGWLAHELPGPALVALRLGLAIAASGIILRFGRNSVQTSPSPA